MCIASLMNLKRGLSLSNQDTRRPRAQIQFIQLHVAASKRQNRTSKSRKARSTEGHSTDNMNVLDHYDPRLSAS
jgi:hypothetical protein